MVWLYIWFGLVLGFVFMIVFFFGILLVFDCEIDCWVVLEICFEVQVMLFYDNMLKDVFVCIEFDLVEFVEVCIWVIKFLFELLQVIGWGVYIMYCDLVLIMYLEFVILNNLDDFVDYVYGYVMVDFWIGEMLLQD